jgi:hypothetical protein
MLGALYLITLEEIVRAHFALQQAVSQFHLCFHGVVDAAHQHALIIDRHAGADQTVASAGGFRCNLIGMIKMSIQPDRSVFRQHVA